MIRFILYFALFETVASTVGVPESLQTRSIDNSMKDEKSSDDAKKSEDDKKSDGDSKPDEGSKE